MKLFDKRGSIVLAVVSVIIILIGVVVAFQSVSSEENSEKWIEKEYDKIETKEDALKVLRKDYKEAEIVNDIKVEGCWLFTSEQQYTYYTYCEETKTFGTIMIMPDENTDNNTNTPSGRPIKPRGEEE